MRTLLILAAAGVLGAGSVTYGQTADDRAAARAVLAKRGDAVVTVLGSLRVRTMMDGQQVQSEEQPIRANATLLDATGLAVMSLSALDPGKVMTTMAGRAAGPGRPKVQIATAPSALRLRLANGSEIAVQIASRDETLDLAFLRPATPASTPLPFVVDAATARLAPLDPLVVVQRLGAFADWKATAAFAYVQTVIEHPRPVYLIAGAPSGLGVPAFDAAAGFVGILVMRNMTPAASSPVGNMMADLAGIDALGMMPVVLPADDIRAAARTVK
jgi:hypothetical protein